MKKLFYVVFILLLALFGLTFSFHNRQTIAIQYYAVEFQVELAPLLLVTFAGGLAVGYAATWMRAFKVRRRLLRRMRELRAQLKLARRDAG